MAANRFGWSDFLWRLLFALFLVGASYNPAGFSYVHWALLDGSSFSPAKAFCGIALIICWTIYVRASLRSLGPVGLGLVGALLGTGVWALFDLGLLSGSSVSFLTYLGLITLSLLMAIGLSWSHVRRRLSGQADIDDVDE